MPKIKSQIDEKAANSFTSMIDIVFLLLIFFILQPFKQPDFRMMAYLPKDEGSASSSSPDVKPTITLRIDGEKSKAIYLVNDEEVKATAIAVRLLRISEGDNTISVTISPSPNIYFSKVLNALDQCAFADMTKVSFAANY